MRFKELQDEVADLVGFTDGAVSNSGFSSAQIKKALNLRYKTETLLAQQEGRKVWFHKTQQFTWPSATTTLTLPSTVDQVNLIRFEDVTTHDPGDPLPGEVFWKDNRTLQWGATSPAQDTTIRATYFARPAEMVNDNDEPELIPPEHRMVLVWSAAIYLRQKADERAPGDWTLELNEARMNLWKALSRGRPLSGNGGPGSYYDIAISGAQADQDGSSINQDNN